MDSQPEVIVLDKERVSKWLQNESLSERVRMVFVGFQLAEHID